MKNIEKILKKIGGIVVISLVVFFVFPEIPIQAMDEIKVESYSISPENEVGKGGTVEIKATASGGSGEYQYKFYVIRNGQKITISDYSNNSSCLWTPYTPATYQVYVEIKDSTGVSVIQIVDEAYKVEKKALQVIETKIQPDSQIYTSESVKISAEAAYGDGNYQYEFYVIRNDEKIVLSKYSDKNEIVWMPYTPATYKVYVNVKDQEGNSVSEEIANRYTVIQKPLQATELSPIAQRCWDNIQLNVKATGGKAPYQYKYYVVRDGQTIMLQDYSSSSSYTWTPYTPADYMVYAEVKDADGNKILKETAATISPVVININQFQVGNKTTFEAGESVKLSTNASNGIGNYTYHYYVVRENQTIELKSYSDENYYLWNPVTPAKYQVIVEVKDSKGNISTEKKDVEVRESSISKSLKLSPTTQVRPGQSVTLTASISCLNESFQYRFYVIRNGQEIELQQYSTNNTYIWKPYTVASYNVMVDMKGNNGSFFTLSQNIKVSKTGWFYEQGYKFYYINGVKQVDLDGIMPKQSNYCIKVNRQTCTVTVYAKDGNNGYIIPVKRFACSVGLASTPTPKGTYYTSDKYRWHTLMGPSYGQYCTRIVNGILFHSVAGYNMTSYNIRANDFNKLGSPASHGCVRLCVRDAKWIYDNCASGTKVVIYDSSNPGPLGKPTTIKIPANQNWDPTDPNVGK